MNTRIQGSSVRAAGAIVAVASGLFMALHDPAFADQSAVPERATRGRDEARNRAAAAAALPCTNPAYECVPSGVYVRSYSDPSGVCTWTLTVNWGDGSAPVVRTLFAGGSVTVSHTYRPGLWTASFDFPPGSSSDPEQTCLPLHEEILIEVPKQDTDGDKIADDVDNCPGDANPLQEDNDKDGAGDACDLDIDGDGILNDRDNCPTIPNKDQRDDNNDGIGHAFDSNEQPDADGDRRPDATDNCPQIANEDQRDTDGDGKGDACDTTVDRDYDRDGVVDSADNCMANANSSQSDGDEDGIGDACDSIDGPGGDTTFSTRRARNQLQTVLPGRPYITVVRAQDTTVNGTADFPDLIGIEFSETMNTTAAEDGASIQVSDRDGTVGRITCGSEAICDQNRGLAIGFHNRRIRDRQDMAVILLTEPSELEAGAVPGLQYPLFIVRVNDKFRDRNDQRLDLSRSDRRIEIGPLTD